MHLKHKSVFIQIGMYVDINALLIAAVIII